MRNNMKKLRARSKYMLMIVGFILFSSTSFANVDCDDEDFLDDCAEQIDGYKYLKANKVNIAAGDAEKSFELSQVFSTGTTYILTACSGGTGMKVTLYDRRKKKIMSNYNSPKKSYYPYITYKCNATGVYYIKYEFDNEGSGCGVGIIGKK